MREEHVVQFKTQKFFNKLTMFFNDYCPKIIHLSTVVIKDMFKSKNIKKNRRVVLLIALQK